MRPDDAFNDWHPDSDLAFDLEMTRNEVAALEEIYNYNEKAQEVLAKRNQTFEDVGSVLFVIKDIRGFFGSADRRILAAGCFQFYPPCLSNRSASSVIHLLGRLRFSMGKVRETEPHNHRP